MIAATKKGIVKAVPPEVKVRSAVGAGDCVIAGLALKLVHLPKVEVCETTIRAWSKSRDFAAS